MDLVELAHRPDSRPDDVRRQNGIYYTPPDIAAALIAWAVRGSTDTVFDPSFGGCVFLRTTISHLEQLGVVNACKQVFGSDWDEDAWGEAIHLVNQGADPGQFARSDFLALVPEEIGGPFDVVVGNPPYVRTRMLPDGDRKTAAIKVGEKFGLSKLASYWAYFVLHALSFLKEEGRLALILPGAFLRSDYARVVRSLLAREFGTVTAVLLEEHLFDAVDEDSVLLLADHKGKGHEFVRVGTATRQKIASGQAKLDKMTRPLTNPEDLQHWARGLFDTEALSLYDEIVAKLSPLGDVATVRIGIVTGRNDYFLVREDSPWATVIESQALHHIVSQTQQLRGIWVTRDEARRLPAKLFFPNKSAIGYGARRYIDHGHVNEIHLGHKCSTREPWFVVREATPPDVFLSCMAWSGMRLVLNQARVLCTNTLLRVDFHPGTSEPERMAYAVGSLSTVAQLSAEIEGRIFGGGLLKIEPSDARRLTIPPVYVDPSDLSRLDQMCREGRWDDARTLVDTMWAQETGEWEALGALQRALYSVRQRRRQRRIR